MKKQTVIWTALPKGITAPDSNGQRRLQLSVMVSPRLMTDEGGPKPKLSQFPDWLDWAAKPLAFQVRFNGGVPVPATITTPVAPSPTLWQGLFSAATYVRPYQFPHLHTKRVRSFPAGNVMGFLREQYTRTAVETAADKDNGYPNLRGLLSRDGLGQIGTYWEMPPDLTHVPTSPEQHLHNQLNELMQKNQAVPPGPPNPALDFHQVKQFYQPRTAQRLTVSKPELDFHQIVAALGDYPEVLRRLGLVLDMEVPFDIGIAASGVVAVEPIWQPSLNATTNVSPRTHYILIGLSQWLPAPRPGSPEIKNGMLDLSSGYSLLNVDVDGAALKALDFVNNLMRAQSSRRRSADTPTRYSLPAMRSGGLGLFRTGRAMQLVQRLHLTKAQNDQAESGADVDLYAEDLTRGYRVDIQLDDGSGPWRSLHRRQGVYKFTKAGTLISAEDEGAISMGVAQSADGSTPDLFLHEGVVNWQGWSLSAPRYGKMVDNDDAAAEVPTEAPPEIGLETIFNPMPRSLPRLRFGRRYRMRARAVDLAGNSLPHDTPDDSTATNPVMYGRMEPISSPMTLLNAPTTQGESVERLVIRSNYDTPASGYAIRHIAPPRVSQLMAETHGLFDGEAGLDKAAYDLIVARETNFNPDAVHPEDQLTLPYLADPLAQGAAFRGLPGTAPQSFTQVAFDGGWPDRLPFRLVVEEGNGAPVWEALTRVLRVRLPKGETVPVRLSTYTGEEGLQVMGLWQWLEEAGLPAAQLNQLKMLALKGGHWMLTPHRNIVLVHAVRQPLEEPAYQTLKADKALGQTHALLQDSVKVSGISTDKLDILANWEEPVDILSEPGPKTLTGQAHAGELSVLYGQTEAPLYLKHDFGDTKYRRVQYSAVATSRYKEYFQESASESLAVAGSAALSHAHLVAGSEEVKLGTQALLKGADYTIDYATGTIARVEGGKIAAGATVSVTYAYLPGSVTRQSAAPTAVDVLNSARPAAPKVLYVVPTFGWSREEMAEGHGSVAIKRSGGGLRVYLDRPWYSSGDGELLGAVLWVRPTGNFIKAPPTTPPEALKPFVTQWGMDPIWLSNPTTVVPSAAHFPLAVRSAAGLSLEEVPGASVAVAGHKVGYDEQRRLWYCDMEVDAGSSYWPFVRLALARYQPNSVTHAHLSRVVLADFAQLAPERLATMVFDPDYPDLVAVTVCGPGYRQWHGGRGASLVEVTVETRAPGQEGDHTWVAASATVQPLALREDDGSSFTWSGGVKLPSDRGSKPYRLVVREYEQFITDGVFQNYTAINMAVPVARRLVYAAVLEI